jgi:hypothetical protein
MTAEARGVGAESAAPTLLARASVSVTVTPTIPAITTRRGAR